MCHYVGGAQTYRPIGDVCSCGSSIVTPAIFPKSVCGCKKVCDKISDFCCSLGALKYKLGYKFLNCGCNIMRNNCRDNNCRQTFWDQ